MIKTKQQIEPRMEPWFGEWKLSLEEALCLGTAEESVALLEHKLRLL